jgi:HSP20 family protein
MKLLGIFRRVRESEFSPAVWNPPADVYQAPWGWLVKFDLAGVRLEDVRLAVQGKKMALSGTRRDTQVEQGCCHYRLEIAYNRFERTLEFPCCLEGARIETELREGMLLVRVQMEEQR